MIPDAPSFNVRELAALFQIQDETVRRWIRRGDLPAIRQPDTGTGYQVLRADLARFVRQQYQPGKTATSLPKLTVQEPSHSDRFHSELDHYPGLIYIATGTLWNRHVVANGGGLAYSESFRSWLECIHPDDRELVDKSRAGGSFELEYRLLHPGGAEVWVEDCVVPAGDGRWYGKIRDITTEQRQRIAYRVNSQAKKLLEQAFAGNTVIQNGLVMASGLPGVKRAETIRHADLDEMPNVVDIPVPGDPEPWGVLRLHTKLPQQLDDLRPLLEQIAGAIGISMLNLHARQHTAHWYSTRDIARLLKVQEETVRRWIRREEIQIMNLGSARAGYRVHPVDLDAFIKERYRHPGVSD